MKSSLTIFILCSCQLIYTQQEVYSPAKKYTAVQLNSDFDILTKSLKEILPELDTYFSEDSLYIYSPKETIK